MFLSYVSKKEESNFTEMLIDIYICFYSSTSDLEDLEYKRESLGLDSDTDGMTDLRKKKKRKHKHHKHKKEKLIEREDDRLDRQEKYNYKT